MIWGAFLAKTVKIGNFLHGSWVLSAGAPEEIRTPDPQIRSLVLYPAQLRALMQLPVNWATGAGAVVLILHLRNGILFRALGSVLHGYFTIRIRNAWAG